MEVMVFKPENEQGVIYLFAQQADAAGFQLLKINAAYPDAVVANGGNEYRVEFEYVASNFDRHGHDPRQCDIIICWENDFPDSVLPVIALDKNGWWQIPIELPSYAEKEAVYWKKRALTAERKLRGDNSWLLEGKSVQLAPQPARVMRSFDAVIDAIMLERERKDCSDIQPPDDRPGWRIEINRKKIASGVGVYWNWRHGSKENMEYAHGGTIDTLPDHILHKYTRHHRRRIYKGKTDAEAATP